MKSFSACLTFVLLLAMAGFTLGQGERPLPQQGEVINPLRLRQAPPRVTPFEYRLAEEVCILDAGTRFKAFETVETLNGETWHRIETTEVKPLSRCPDEPLNGWIAGRLKTGRALVSIGGFEQPPAVRTPETTDKPGTSSQPVEESEGSNYYPALQFIFLILGTFMGVSVMAIEKEGSLHPKNWLNRILVFEFIILSVVNSVFVWLIIHYLGDPSRDRSEFYIHAFQFFSESPYSYGFLFVGFALAILLMRSFAPQRRAQA